MTERIEFVGIAELEPLIREVVSAGGGFPLMPGGVSMMPLIRPSRDSVTLVSADGIKQNDILLYKRDDGSFALHRVVKICGGEYIMCGDNQTEFERGVYTRHVIAKVGGILRDGEGKIDMSGKKYARYVKRRAFQRPFRKINRLLRGKKA